MIKKAVYIILAVLIVVVYINYIKPIPEKRQAIRDEIFLKAKKLNKYRRLTKQKESIKKQLEVLKINLQKMEDFYLPAKNETLGLVTIQQIVRDLSTKADLKIIALRPVDMIRGNYMIGLPVQVTAVGTMKSLTEFLKGVTESPYLLSIDMLNIRVVNIQKPDMLRIKFTLTGYIKQNNKEKSFKEKTNV